MTYDLLPEIENQIGPLNQFQKDAVKKITGSDIKDLSGLRLGFRILEALSDEKTVILTNKRDNQSVYYKLSFDNESVSFTELVSSDLSDGYRWDNVNDKNHFNKFRIKINKGSTEMSFPAFGNVVDVSKIDFFSNYTVSIYDYGAQIENIGNNNAVPEYHNVLYYQGKGSERKIVEFHESGDRTVGTCEETIGGESELKNMWLIASRVNQERAKKQRNQFIDGNENGKAITDLEKYFEKKDRLLTQEEIDQLRLLFDFYFGMNSNLKFSQHNNSDLVIVQDCDHMDKTYILNVGPSIRFYEVTSGDRLPSNFVEMPILGKDEQPLLTEVLTVEDDIVSVQKDPKKKNEFICSIYSGLSKIGRNPDTKPSKQIRCHLENGELVQDSENRIVLNAFPDALMKKDILYIMKEVGQTVGKSYSSNIQTARHRIDSLL